MSPRRTRRDRLGGWCGWVLAGAAALTPVLAWLGPLGFAPLLSLVGLLCLPALKVSEDDRPVAVALLALLLWAAVSAAWSPFRGDLGHSIALKLALQLPLYWSAWSAARRAGARQRRIALLIFAWGLAGLGVLLLAEAATQGAVYLALRDMTNQPIRPDLGRKNLAQASFVLALLWPLATAGGMRAGAPWQLAIPMAAGSFALGLALGSDAPVLALPVSLVAGWAVLTWPKSAPKALGLVAGAYVLLVPAVVLGVRSLASSMRVGFAGPESWAERVAYWSRAIDLIGETPLRGWGLDASRTFQGIGLHPHDGGLQIWLELGALGAAAAALLWILALRRLSRERRDPVAAGAAASAVAYLLFGALNFGVWQEWWLALGGLTAALAALAGGEVAAASGGSRRRSAARSST